MTLSKVWFTLHNFTDSLSNFIVRNGISEAETTNNKTLRIIMKLILMPFSTFLPRDAMHKRGLCRHAVSSLSVRLSVTFVDHCQNE